MYYSLAAQPCRFLIVAARGRSESAVLTKEEIGNMIYLLSIVLGLIQALTEFLPISSSAHLLLARAALDFDVIDGLTFDVGLHVGTLLAIVIYFRRDMAELIRGFITSVAKPDLANDANQRLVWFIVAASIPAALVGIFLEEAIELYFRNPSVVVVTLVLGGVLFLVAERVTKQECDITSLTLRSCVFIGFAQALALIPGVSRSGITIVAGLTQRLERAEAARFSFLLGPPAIFGAGVIKAVDLSGQALGGRELGVLLVGTVTAAAVGWLVIRFLLFYLRKHRLDLFAYYRFALAAAVAAYLLLSR
jgi:undecaprenyl-diphosphatase